jgi:anaerobic dimethyl sulfoxide reductase subunit B (iron-sulfur subunit)
MIRPPMSQLAFYLDVSSCSGCKACQIACKDRHGLETGRLWRRVVEVEGGEWHREGEAWRPTVFAYSLSISCLHCQAPACLAACPSGAIARHSDGLVVVDEGRCLGCRYCSWACPYGVPQFAEATGTMSKCNACVEDRREGLPPACVAACPLRALDFGDLDELRQRYGSLDAIPPLPDGSLTKPSVVITAPGGIRPEPVTVVNAEEIQR